MLIPALILIFFIFFSVIIAMGTLKLDFNLLIPMYVFIYFMTITTINIHYSILFKELTKNHENLDNDDPSDKTPEEKNPYKGAFDDSGSSW